MYKNELLPLFFNSPEIVEVLDNKDIDPECPDELVYNNIYPFLFVPENQTEVKTFICIDLFVNNIIDNLLKNVVLQVCIFSHQNHLRTNKGYSRVDYLQHQIDKILNGNKRFGIDGIQLKSSLPISMGTDSPYRGKELIYIIPELNQDRCGDWDEV